MSKNFGHTTLPDDVEDALKKAKLLEWLTLAWLVITVVTVFVVMGSSQAMKAAWVEDMLSFLPPLAFLVAVRIAHKKPDHGHAFGHHRAIGAAHLSAGVALLGMGLFLIYDSAMTLIKAEHPTIGTVHMFGATFWHGWLMIAALVLTSIPTIILGRLKLSVSKTLHDKVLYADADMNKADWQTAAGGILGIIGIGFGLWWADSVVAILIAASIVHDGVSNVRGAVRDLMDGTARTHDDKRPLHLIEDVEHVFREQEWADDVQIRMRDMGHVMHTEVFVIPNREVRVNELDAARRAASSLDWKLDDLVVVPVREFPHLHGED